MFYTYILESAKNKKYYVGYTGNIENRIIEHNNKGSYWTKSGVPWKIVYKKEFKEKSEAIKFERYLKQLKSRVVLQKYIAG